MYFNQIDRKIPRLKVQKECKYTVVLIFKNQVGNS